LLASLDELIAGKPSLGDFAVVIGESHGHLGQSALLAEAFGIEAGDAPSVDLAAEKRNGEFIRANRKAIRACTDLSDGGLALAAFEMAEAAGIGLALDPSDIPTLFGEDQARYLIAVEAADLGALKAAAEQADVPLTMAGQFGGSVIRLGQEEAKLDELSALYRGAFAAAIGL
jgi:phosphoribosylformylglycinamidine synthase subunit PurL